MTLEAQPLLVLLVTIVLYITLPLWLLGRGWLFRSGLVALIISLLPAICRAILWPSTAGHFGLFTMILFPLPFLLLAVGLIVALARLAKWAFRGRAKQAES